MAIQNELVKPEYDKFEIKLQKALDHLKGELSAIRAGRANPQILSKITIDYYGTTTPLSQMANISVPDARTLLISPWDASQVKEMVKAIQTSDLGLNPADDGKVIRLSFPQPTEERRKELSKQAKKIVEESKVVLRNERRDILEVFKKFKKDSVISEDEFASYDKDVQKLLDKYVEMSDAILKEKEKEILEI